MYGIRAVGRSRVAADEKGEPISHSSKRPGGANAGAPELCKAGVSLARGMDEIPHGSTAVLDACRAVSFW